MGMPEALAKPRARRERAMHGYHMGTGLVVGYARRSLSLWFFTHSDCAAPALRLSQSIDAANHVGVDLMQSLGT
jgi:hypothetical protein